MFPISPARFVAVWLTLAAVMTANGIGRELFLKRVFSPRPADTISVAAGILFIAIVSIIGFRPLAATAPGRQRALLSVALVVATVAFETLLGRVVDHKSWSTLLQHYALWRGNLWPLVLAWLAYMPFVN
jgi:hypothetical protein